ncbi:MAG: NfeD family protein [Agarilytica sp.]
MDILMSLSPWHWLILGVVLFAVEILGTGGFLLGVAAASAVTSVVAWLGFDWQFQVISFAVLSIGFSFAYWKFFKNFNLERSEPVVINEKMESLIGAVGKVVSVVSPLTGKVQIADTLWEFKSTEPVEEGGFVQVEAHNGMTLEVSPQ